MHTPVPAPALFAPFFIAVTMLIGGMLYGMTLRHLRRVSMLHGMGELRAWIAGVPALLWAAWFFNDLLDMTSDLSRHALWPLEIALGAILWLAALAAVRVWLTVWAALIDRAEHRLS